MAASIQQPSTSTEQAEKSTGDVIADLWKLIKEYGRQETIDPLQNLGRFVGFGAPGSILLGLGVLFLSLGLLRVMQVRDGVIGRHLTGSLTWVPYAVTLVVAVLLILLAVMAMRRTAKGNSDVPARTAKEGT